ncbi:MAG TPA: hypothetical protein VG347_00845 [Verrucomicrobiae bacterium]|nr:hypothetical protein [Verrucomicrobiae bacterium]
MDGSYANIISGSHRSHESAARLLDVAKSKYPDRANTICVRRDFSYLNLVDGKGTNLNPCHTLIEEMRKKGWACFLTFGRSGKHMAQFHQSAEVSDFFESENITDAICNAALQALGLLEKYPF